MIYRTLVVLLAAVNVGAYSDSINSKLANNATGICGYEANCATGGYDGACVSIGNGCCPDGTVTSGLCPGSSDIRCCTKSTCSTPAGGGRCMGVNQCAGSGGRSYAGYCSGSSNVQCCVTGGPGPSPSGYNPDAAVNWANGNCGGNPDYGCSQFAAMAAHAGGAFPGLTDYTSYRGYNLRWVSQLHRALLDEGWSESGTANNCGERGDILIFNIDGDPDAHAAVAIGNCQLDQNNPARCGHAANWGPNKVLSKR